MIRAGRLPSFIVNLCCVLGLLTVGTNLSCGEEPADAEKGPDAGHSYHGEAFNEGPRQEAYLMNGTGNVTFPATTKSELAQKFIDQGVGQLHGFWYFEAERSFRQAAALDPDCAIAYWGMAMANNRNEKRAKGFMAEAMKRRENITEREKDYIEALNRYWSTGKEKDKQRKEKYLSDLENLALDYPDDLEAKAFLCLQIYLNRSASKIQSYLATNALLQDILNKNPMHPVHHYVIHLWDYKKPERALKSASLCGQSAPSIAHMWHMPGHIYSRLKRYNDAVWQQEASARVDHEHMIRDRVLPDQIHNFAHNNEWLIRNLLYTGRIHDAIDLAKNMIELPRHPKYNRVTKRGSSAYYGRLRLFSALNQNEMWPELIAMCETPMLEPTDDVGQQIKRLRYLGRAYYQSGQLSQAREIYQEVEEFKADLEKKKLDAQIKAEDELLAKAKKTTKRGKDQTEEEYELELFRKNSKAVKKAQDEAAKPFSSDLRALDKAFEEFKGHEAYATKDYEEAYVWLRKSGGLDLMFLNEVKRLSGDEKGALQAAESHLTKHKNETIPLAQSIQMHWKADKKSEAKKQFETLREISEPIDLDTPIFAALSPIAKEFGYPVDWRIPLKKATDVGDRPELASLGPFRWRPSPAEPWSLEDHEGKNYSLSDYRGKPVVVIFYLGFGCLHCVEQLKAFAPKADEFERQGISLIAISTESKAALQIALKNYNEKQAYAFPLVCDPEYRVFKSYRAFDDFEEQPLHGTFLIDAEGQVRWHDISYEPFMEPDFVLEEAARLLGQTYKPGGVVAMKSLKPVSPASPAVAEKP